MSLFFKDTINKIYATWETLINDLSTVVSYNSYCRSENYYEVFKHIILSMILGNEIVLLDSDYTDSELKRTTGYYEYNKFNEPLKNDDIGVLRDKKELLSKLKNTSEDWKVTLFTSGTTGIPQKVTHNFRSITRFIKYSDKNSSSIWGFAYSPTHMAGTQVFLQALLNGSAIIRLFGLLPEEIHREINKNKITHISATPTFYKLLLPCKYTFPSVERITSGGERFNEKTIKQLVEIFPNAKITNVYASTEAGTLFASNNDVFSIKSEYEKLVKVENDELLIHKSLIGYSDINFNEWYETGDLVELINSDPLMFRFISRKSDMINVGGYKVNPIEVEEAILSLSEIKDVRVYSKSNSILGNIICCDVISSDDRITEYTIRAYLRTKIQEYKIPRTIRFVNELSTTRTGKIRRTPN